MRRSRIIMLGLGLVAFLQLHDGYVRAGAVAHTQARVERIETLCSATTNVRTGYTWQKGRPLAEQDCERVRDLTSRHQDYRGHRVFEHDYVIFSYVSPQDGSARTGRHAVDRLPGIGRISVGDALTVRIGTNGAEPVELKTRT